MGFAIGLQSRHHRLADAIIGAAIAKIRGERCVHAKLIVQGLAQCSRVMRINVFTLQKLFVPVHDAAKESDCSMQALSLRRRRVSTCRAHTLVRCMRPAISSEVRPSR